MIFLREPFRFSRSECASRSGDAYVKNFFLPGRHSPAGGPSHRGAAAERRHPCRRLDAYHLPAPVDSPELGADGVEFSKGERVVGELSRAVAAGGEDGGRVRLAVGHDREVRGDIGGDRGRNVHVGQGCRVKNCFTSARISRG